MNKLQEYIIVSISFLITITTFSTHYVYVPTFKTILTLSSSIMIDKGDTATLHMITLQTVKNFHFSSSLVTACNAVSTPVLLYTTVRVSE